jgi:hypothetical protein
LAARVVMARAALFQAGDLPAALAGIRKKA